MRLLSLSIFPLVSFLLVLSFASGHETSVNAADITLEERLGRYIPLDATFVDETGKRLTLGEVIDRPTIIAPVYLGCMHTCPLLLTGLAESLGKVSKIKPGNDFRVITLSFDEKDTPDIARGKKRNYLAAVGSSFPPEAWTFLTGNAKDIKRFLDSIGFTIQRDGSEFSHPVAIVVVARDGKIVRYLYGTTFLPFDITMSVTEAAEGRVGSTAGRILMYCFSYDPLKKSYVFNILRVGGAAVIIFVISFLAYLIITSKRPKGRRP